MAKHLDLEEQEQLEALKHFWNSWGNLITWVLIVALGAYAAHNGWNWWKQRQGAQASALYGELERSAEQADTQRLQRVLSDMQANYAGTAYASHGALLAARVFNDQQQLAEAKTALAWVVDKGSDDGLKAVARLRLASLQMGEGAHDQALQTLSASFPSAFAALAADRRGDVLLLQGKRNEAAAEFGKAWQALGREGAAYRELVGVKLNALGIDPQAGTRSGAAS